MAERFADWGGKNWRDLDGGGPGGGTGLGCDCGDRDERGPGAGFRGGSGHRPGTAGGGPGAAVSDRAARTIANWRLTTARQQTVDEYGVLTRNLFTLAGLDRDAIGGVIISSVVPPVNWTLGEMARIYFGQKALFVEAGVKTGMSVLVDNPL